MGEIPHGRPIPDLAHGQLTEGSYLRWAEVQARPERAAVHVLEGAVTGHCRTSTRVQAMPARSAGCRFALLQPYRGYACYELARLARPRTEPLVAERRFLLS